MTPKTITVLFVADIVGESGILITRRVLSTVKKKHAVDFCIANGENAYQGKGLTKRVADDLFSAGINVITSGNHFWDKGHSIRKLGNFDAILRPENYPEENIGTGSHIYFIKDNLKIAVLNLQGRTFMYPIDCPFKIGMQKIRDLRKATRMILVDFHAEATAEKRALGYYFDGKVSAVIGTHTHVQTSDEQILPKGTAFITDVGMTGPAESVIGIKREVAIKRFLYQTPVQYLVANGIAQFNAAVIKIDINTGNAVMIKRIAFSDENA